jgi:hypothetical protein
MGADGAFSQQKTYVWGTQVAICSVEVSVPYRADSVNCTLIAEQVI